MKILSIIDSNDLYGKERANFNVDHLLKASGFGVVVLINAHANEKVRNEASPFKHYDVRFPRNIEEAHRCWRYLKYFFLTIMEVKRILKIEQPDYVLVPTEIALSYLFLALIGTKAKVIFRCGDSPLVKRKRGVLKNIYSILWQHLICKRVDVLVCNARFLMRQMIESGYKLKAKDTVIYNYPPERVVIDDKAIYTNHKRLTRIGFMGRIVPDKGVLELCQAAIKLYDEGYIATYYLAGDVPYEEEYFKTINDVLKRNPEFKNYVHFVGNVNNLEKFYKNIDVVCIPSVYAEPMANVVTEAKAHHKASIIFNRGGMPEIVEHKNTGYICPDVSVESLAEGIKFYLDNPDLVKVHGENAYKSIEELGLTKESYTEKWLKVFS